MVPHMIYFVDLAVRGRGLDPGLGALTWLLFGTGAILGTLTGGRAADRWGGPRALRIWLAFQAAALALALPSSAASPLCRRASRRVRRPRRHRRGARPRPRTRRSGGGRWSGCARPPSTPWRRPLTGFALTPLFAHTGSHLAVFAAGLAVSIAALLVSIRDR